VPDSIKLTEIVARKSAKLPFPEFLQSVLGCWMACTLLFVMTVIWSFQSNARKNGDVTPFIFCSCFLSTGNPILSLLLDK
jgi:hypothetical protein